MLSPILLALTCFAAQDDRVVDWLRFGEDRIEILETGELGRRYVGEPETEVSRLLERAAAFERAERALGREIPEWRVVLLLVKHLDADTGDHTQPSIRVSMSEVEQLHCLESFLAFVDLAHAATQGRVKIRYEVVIAERPIRVPADEPISWLPESGQEVVDFLSPGDTDSVIAYFKPGTLPIRQWGATKGGDFGPGGAAISSLALVPEREKSEPDALALATLHEWLHQVEWLAQAQLGHEGLPGSHDMAANGYSWSPGKSWLIYRDLLRFYLPRDFFERASIRTWARHREAGLKAGANPMLSVNPGLPPQPERVQVPEYEAGKSYDWEDVRDDPFGKLPRLGAEWFRDQPKDSIPQYTWDEPHAIVVSLFAQGGRPSWERLAPTLDPTLRARMASTSGPRFDLRMDFHHESVEVIGVDRGQGTTFLVRPDMADLIHARLATISGERPRVVGTIVRERRAIIVFEGQPKLARSLLSMLRHPIPDTLGGGRSRSLLARAVGPGYYGEVIRGRPVELRLEWADVDSEDVPPLDVTWWRRCPEPMRLEATRLGDTSWSIETDADSPLGTWVLAAEICSPSGRSSYRPLSFELTDWASIRVHPDRPWIVDGMPIEVHIGRVIEEIESARVKVSPPKGWTTSDPEDIDFSQRPFRLERVLERAEADLHTRSGELVVTVTPKNDAPASRLSKTVHFADGAGRWFVRDFERRGEEAELLPEEGRDGPGEYSISWETVDPISGARSLRIDDGGGSRYGRVQLFGDRDDPLVPIQDRTRLPVWPETVIELAYRAEGRLGELAVSMRVDGKWYSAPVTENAAEMAEEAGREIITHVESSYRADGARHVRIDLGKQIGKDEYPRMIDRIDFGDPRPLISNRYRGAPSGVIVLDDFVVREE
ncbi:MAG: hypothetical protein RL885_04445 [Planctomycetota bacterium]